MNNTITGKNKYYSVSRKFLRENKTNKEFEIILNSLTLEDIIALKLELSYEFQLVNAEISAGYTRIEALKHLVDRTGIDEVKSLVNLPSDKLMQVSCFFSYQNNKNFSVEKPLSQFFLNCLFPF